MKRGHQRTMSSARTRECNWLRSTSLCRWNGSASSTAGCATCPPCSSRRMRAPTETRRPPSTSPWPPSGNGPTRRRNLRSVFFFLFHFHRVLPGLIDPHSVLFDPTIMELSIKLNFISLERRSYFLKTWSCERRQEYFHFNCKKTKRLWKQYWTWK